MLLNGHTKVQSTFARVMGYVEQFDIHSPMVRDRAGAGNNAGIGTSADPSQGEGKNQMCGTADDVVHPSQYARWQHTACQRGR